MHFNFLQFFGNNIICYLAESHVREIRGRGSNISDPATAFPNLPKNRDTNYTAGTGLHSNN